MKYTILVLALMTLSLGAMAQTAPAAPAAASPDVPQGDCAGRVSTAERGAPPVTSGDSATPAPAAAPVTGG